MCSGVGVGVGAGVWKWVRVWAWVRAAQRHTSLERGGGAGREVALDLHPVRLPQAVPRQLHALLQLPVVGEDEQSLRVVVETTRRAQPADAAGRVRDVI